MICLKRDIRLLLKSLQILRPKTPSQVPSKNRVISVDLAAGGGGRERGRGALPPPSCQSFQPRALRLTDITLLAVKLRADVTR